MRKNIVSTPPESSESGNPDFISEKELLKRVPACRRTIINWRQKEIIPFICLGRKKVIYHWPSVEAALLKLQ
jgi:hypothetical protein